MSADPELMICGHPIDPDNAYRYAGPGDGSHLYTHTAEELGRRSHDWLVQECLMLQGMVRDRDRQHGRSLADVTSAEARANIALHALDLDDPDVRAGVLAEYPPPNPALFAPASVDVVKRLRARGKKVRRGE